MRAHRLYLLTTPVLPVVAVALPFMSGCGRKQTRPGTGGIITGTRPTSFRSNGERIYFTAVGDQGRRIKFHGGPSWLTTKGGSCVDCHGPEGKGGKPVLMGTAVPTDIRYRALTTHEHEERKRHEEHEHEEHPAYTDMLIKRAITEGLDPASKPLDLTMPRWRMSERDLGDLIAFLKQLDTD